MMGIIDKTTYTFTCSQCGAKESASVLGAVPHGRAALHFHYLTPRGVVEAETSQNSLLPHVRNAARRRLCSLVMAGSLGKPSPNNFIKPTYTMLRFMCAVYEQR